MVHAPPSPGFAVGDRVRCRDAAVDEWLLGTVTDAKGPQVLPDELGAMVGMRPGTWDEVELLEPARPESFPFWVCFRPFRV
eukprot:gene16121-biopygen4596